MSAPHDPRALLAQGRAAEDRCEPELALKFYERIPEGNAPEDVAEAALERRAEILVSVGRPAEAQRIYRALCEKSPGADALRWLNLGQLESGAEALACFARGQAILRERLAAPGTAQGERDLCARRLCSACVSVAELYMTDLCMEPDAEERCEAALALAEQTDAGGPELPQAKASCRLSQERPEEAAALALEAARRATAAVAAADAALTTLEAAAAGGAAPGGAAALERPELELRVNVAKLLLECAAQADAGAAGPCAEAAGDLVYGCLKEDDDNVELWFLMGCAAQLMAPPNLELSRECLERAQGMLAKVREALVQQGIAYPYAEQEAALLGQLDLQAAMERKAAVEGDDAMEAEDAAAAAAAAAAEDYGDDDGEEGVPALVDA